MRFTRRRGCSPAIVLLGLMLTRFAASSVDPVAPPKWSTLPVDTLLRSRSVNNTIVIMVGTGGFLDLIQNMVCRLKEMHIQNYVVNALDRAVWDFCVERNIPALRVTALGSKKVYPAVGLHHSPEFKTIVREKQVSIVRALDLGLNVLMTDVDMFWVKDPLEKVASLTGFDFVIHSGARLNKPRYEWINAGFLYARPTPAAISALQEVMNITYGAQIREGIAVNQVFCGNGQFGAEDGVTCSNPTHGSKVYILDQTEFQTTDIFLYDADWDVLMESDVYLLHFKNAFNFEYERKRMFMSEASMWLLDASMNCAYTFNATSTHEAMFNAVRHARRILRRKCYDLRRKGLGKRADDDIIIVIHRSFFSVLLWVVLLLGLLGCGWRCCNGGRRNQGVDRRCCNKVSLLGSFKLYKLPRSKPA